MLRLVPLMFALMMPICHSAWAFDVQPSVGEVVFLIGAGQRMDSNGEAVKIVRGMPLYPGDTIETGEGGHVHIRFVDEGFVSVRPASRLRIEAYAAHPGEPDKTRIRFMLEHGVVRSITGKAAEAAHERFRLNTPVVAIGIKGTDFVARAESGATQVMVHSGAVVVSPLGEGCRADGLGGCETPATRLLTEAMKGVMVEFNPRLPAPRLAPVDGRGVDHDRPPALEEPKAGVGRSSAEVKLMPEAGGAYLLREVDGGVPGTPSALVWGRWTEAVRPGDSLTLAYAQAADGRQITVGDAYYGLFRAPSSEGGSRLMGDAAGTVSFRLDQAQAYLDRQGVLSSARVDDARLAIDFGARQFATDMKLSHPEIGTAGLNVTGRINDEGVFIGRASDAHVAGAISSDNREAAYLFERTVEGGRLTGVTHWSR